jgi:hypothetical protein
MSFTYESIVPWGRSFDEYRHMFALSALDLDTRILGCGDGPAGFNAHMRRRGGRVISCDPLYRFSAQQVEARIRATYPVVIEQTRREQHKFVWDSIRSVDKLGEIRMAAMHSFLADFEDGKRQGRYVCAEAPHLPFARGAFELALCSHFLFLYTDHLSLEFHQQAILDMLRVAKEARIFPLLDYNAGRSPYLEPVRASLERAGHKVFIEPVPYEFQRGGKEMLRVISTQ